MAKLDRIYQRLFGSTGSPTDFGEFGSLAEGTPTTTTDPVDMQSRAAWLGGWKSAVVADNAPAIEDFNALSYVLCRQIAYLMQDGIPEWDAETTYYIGSIVKSGSDTFVSLTDDNIGNAVTDEGTWDQVSQRGNPTGTVIHSASASTPSGYLYCDGSLVSRTTYSRLFSAIGTAFGTGDGSTTFKLPDLRGQFVRGLNDSSGLDPDAASRTTFEAVSTGGNTGDNIGSWQQHEFYAHDHSVKIATSAGGGANQVTGGTGFLSDGDPVNDRGGSETRPKNVYLKFFIKT